MSYTYTAILEPTSTGFSAYIPDLPGCVAAGASREETERLIHEAAELHVVSLRAHNEPVPAPTSNTFNFTVSALEA